jgi:hypothetical protein
VPPLANTALSRDKAVATATLAQSGGNRQQERHNAKNAKGGTQKNPRLWIRKLPACDHPSHGKQGCLPLQLLTTLERTLTHCGAGAPAGQIPPPFRNSSSFQLRCGQRRRDAGATTSHHRCVDPCSPTHNEPCPIVVRASLAGRSSERSLLAREIPPTPKEPRPLWCVRP